jgi:uncharacterized surface protein with fasciclin (FAS1) repeats
MNTSLRRTSGLAALALVATIGLAACSEDSGDATASSDGGSSSSAPMESGSPSDMSSDMTSDMSNDMSDEPFGPACSDIPASGPGSFQGMTSAPVASAASANPVLKTLVTAVKQAGLVDTLNSAEDITVFAPANAAFEKIPPKTLKAVLADKKTLTDILTYHVVPGRLAPDQLAGSHKTLQGGKLMVKGSGEDFTVGSDGAKVVCGNVQTANATVYVIDSVLMPS